MENNKNQPAFPVLEVKQLGDKLLLDCAAVGVSKREYFAGLALQGLIACADVKFASTAENFARHAVEIADALLSELSKTQP
jgi:hypothetical protein